MLKKRVIVVLTFVEGVLFRTRNFNADYRFTKNFVGTWSVDELVLLDVTPGTKSVTPQFLDVLKSFSKNCFLPISAGGGVHSEEDCRKLLHCGADKVVIGTEFFENPGFVTKMASIFGSQAIIVSIDTKQKLGDHLVYCSKGTIEQVGNAVSWVKRAQDSKAGEVLIQSIERDGTLEGYDISLVKKVSNIAEIPLLVCSGAGSWAHFYNALGIRGVDGVCTTNIFHFTEASMASAKSYLFSKGLDVRLVK